MPAVTATFKLSTGALMERVTCPSRCASTSSDNPAPSLPRTITTGRDLSSSRGSSPPAIAARYGRTPQSRSVAAHRLQRHHRPPGSQRCFPPMLAQLLASTGQRCRWRRRRRLRSRPQFEQQRNRSHILEKKSSTRKRRLAHEAEVVAADQPRMKRLLGER